MHNYLKLSAIDPINSIHAEKTTTLPQGRIFNIEAIVIKYYANHYWIHYNEHDVSLEDQDILQLDQQLFKVQLMGQQRLFNHLPEPISNQSVAEPISCYPAHESTPLMSKPEEGSLDFLFNSSIAAEKPHVE